MQNKTLNGLVALVAALLLGGAASAKVPTPEARVSLRVEGRTLTEVVQFLREQSGANIVVLGGGEKEISLDLSDVPWREALDLAAELADCVVDERTAGVLAVDEPERVTFSFQDRDLREVIDTIAKLSGANIVVAPEVAGALSLNLTDVPWRDALEVAVKTLGFVVVKENRGILRVVDPLSLQAQMETQVYALRFLRPMADYVPVLKSEFAQQRTRTQRAGGGAGGGGTSALESDVKSFPIIEALRKALSPSGELDYIRVRNSIIVRDTIRVHAAIKGLLEEMDVEPGQVFVDVKFVTSTNEDIFSLGFDYGDLGPQVTISGGQIPISLPFDLGNGGLDDLIIASPNGEGPFVDPSMNGGSTFVPDTIFGALSFTQVAATLRMLQRDVSTEVIQAPKLLTLDGEAATIFVGETIRYAEASSEQGQAGGLELSIQEADNSPVEVGFQLLIKPHLIPGTNKLRMEVIPKETSLTGKGNPTIAPPGFDVFTIGASGLEGTIALPRQRSSTIVTSMILESGQPVMIGGLATDTELERYSEVPLLADIPYLGELFKFREENATRRTLMVFITPTIVRSSGDTQRMLENELRHRREDFGNRLRQILYGDDNGDGDGSALVPGEGRGMVAALDRPVGDSTFEYAPFVDELAGDPGPQPETDR